MAVSSVVRPNYKEIQAKRSREPHKGRGDGWLRHDPALRACGQTALVGTCEAGHEYSRIIHCNREWCPACGRSGSAVHMRRFARWLPKLQQCETVGYWVIEWPTEARERLRDVDSLREAGKLAAKTFKALGYVRGLRRWHWFGDPRCPEGCRPATRADKPVENEDGTCTCRVCGSVFDLADAAAKWNPHLNILVDGTYLTPEALEAEKDEIRRAFGEPRLIVHYSYRRTPGHMIHAVKYVTRGTFRRLEWDREMSYRLKGFRNTSWWGAKHWQEPPQWELEAVEEEQETPALVAIEGGECPECGAPVEWSREIIGWDRVVRYWHVHEVGGGYHRLVAPDPYAPIHNC